jgi:bifunctional non-homologous end joining protein LigD
MAKRARGNRPQRDRAATSPFVPMKAAPADRLPHDDDLWAFEIKWDGYRVITVIDVEAETAAMWSSNGLSATSRFGSTVEGIWEAVHGTSAIIDGEVIAFDERGRPSFQALQRGSDRLGYIVFDLLRLNGHDTTGLPYTDRRKLLREVLEDGLGWKVGQWQVGGGAELFDLTESQGLEGIIAKRADSRYEPGKRSGAWRKLKHMKRQEFVVGGWLPGEGNREGTFGALLVGVHERIGGPLTFSGRVGTGFDEPTLKAILAKLRAAAAPDSPFETGAMASPVRRAGQWVRPQLVVEVGFSEWTNEGLLRHPRFLGLRDDKPATEVVRET